MSLTRRLSLSWTALNGTMRAGIRIGQLEKELEVELSPEEDDEKDEEDLFIFKI